MTAFYRDNKGLESVSGDYLICTVPLEVMHRIEFAPGLSAGKLRTARQVTYDSSTKVLARTSRRFWESDEGIYGSGTWTVGKDRKALPDWTVFHKNVWARKVE